MTPLMGRGEQTNVPTTPEEMAAAQEKLRVANAKEEQANQEARARVATEAEREQARQDIINSEYYQLQASLFELARVTGNMNAYINSAMHAIAVLLAGMKNPGDQAKVIALITQRAAEMQAAKAQPEGSKQ